MGTKENALEIPTNRQYKDRLFRLVFGDEKNKPFLLSLYNALNETDYTDTELLTITTIQDVIYMGMKNDVSFIIDSELNLFEQQSTYNQNMPYRQFEYYAKIADAWVSTNHLDIYGNTLVQLPAPKCYTFYNGVAEQGDRQILHLSDAFMKPSEGYEWTVIMLNINEGHNRELLEQCQALAEYSSLITLVRENKKTMSANTAVDAAVQTMIARGGVLSEFLKIHRSEVLDVCITEYNEELHIRNVEKTSEARGKAIGRAEERINTTIEYVNDGFLTPAQAAQKLGLVLDEFMNKYGSLLKPTV